jgi:hypothetical protein
MNPSSGTEVFLLWEGHYADQHLHGIFTSMNELYKAMEKGHFTEEPWAERRTINTMFSDDKAQIFIEFTDEEE